MAPKDLACEQALGPGLRGFFPSSPTPSPSRELARRLRKTLNDARSKILHDNKLLSAWKTLLQQITCNLTNGRDALHHQTKELFKTICEKFCKRRCITFLAIDHLNSKNEEQKTALRQMLQLSF